MVRIIAAGVLIVLVAAVAAVFSVNTFAQTANSAIESEPVTARTAISNTNPAGNGDDMDNGRSVQVDPPAGTEIPSGVEVDFQRLMIEHRRELLDDRAAYVDHWLSAIAIFLMILSIVAVFGGYVGFKRFREIETDVKNNSRNCSILG